MLEKTRNTTDFHAVSNPLDDISNPPCFDVTLLLRTFPKVEKIIYNILNKKLLKFYLSETSDQLEKKITFVMSKVSENDPK